MLASLADNHTLIFRLDTLILLVASHGAGKRVPSVEDLDRWLNPQFVLKLYSGIGYHISPSVVSGSESLTGHFLLKLHTLEITAWGELVDRIEFCDPATM